jgi:hypothetical protein
MAIYIDFPPIDSAYHNYAEMMPRSSRLLLPIPHRQLFQHRRSYEGREMWAAKISDNVATDEDEPEVLFIGQHHAREHITVEMTLYILHLLADNYGSDQQITDLVNSRETYIIFTTNPDGRNTTSDRLVPLGRKPPAQPGSSSSAPTKPQHDSAWRVVCSRRARPIAALRPFLPRHRDPRFANSRVVGASSRSNRTNFTVWPTGPLAVWLHVYRSAQRHDPG